MEFRKFLIAASVIAYAAAATIGCDAKKKVEDEASETPSTNEPVVSVNLSAASTSQTVSTCFAVTATAIGASATTVTADQDSTFTLAVTSGTGVFYSDSSCTTPATSGTILTDESTTTLYFKSGTIETTSVQATINSTAGTAWSGTIYGPNATAAQMASTQTGQTCIQVSFYYKNGSSITTLPYNSTVTLTQTSGAGVTFYDGVGCTGNNLTTGSVSTFTVTANQSGKTLYGSCATGSQNFYFTAAWGYTQNSVTTSGSNTVYYQNW